jgi:Tfp pilus assembly protein PilO
LVILTKIYAGRAGSSDTKNRRKPKLRTADFNAHQIIKKIILAIVLLILTSFIVGFFVINTLSNNVEKLANKKSELTTLNNNYE